MKKLLTVILLSGLSLVAYSQTFNSTNQETIKDSLAEMKEKVGKLESESLQRAVLYYGFGGLGGILALSDLEESEREVVFLKNLSKLNGLTTEQIIEMHQKEVGGSKPIIKDNTVAKNDDAEYDWRQYLDNIEILELSAKRIDTYSEKGIPAVRIGLKNNGDKTVEYLKATVFFKDKNNSAIYEKDITPINTEAISFQRDNKPLHPNYIYEMPTNKYITIDAPLSQWDEGNIDFEIVEIKFSKDK